MTCDICMILENRDAFAFVYEDEHVFAILHESPATPGHTLVIPKEHATILEELGDKEVEKLFNAANKISSSLFDTLGAHGTNIVVNNGADAGQELPHVVLHVMPRKESDKLDFEWEAKQADPASLERVSNALAPFVDSVFSGRDKLPEVKVVHDEPSHDKPSHDEPREHTREKKPKEDYLSKSLRRIP